MRKAVWVPTLIVSSSLLGDIIISIARTAHAPVLQVQYSQRRGNFCPSTSRVWVWVLLCIWGLLVPVAASRLWCAACTGYLHGVWHEWEGCIGPLGAYPACLWEPGHSWRSGERPLWCVGQACRNLSWCQGHTEQCAIWLLPSAPAWCQPWGVCLVLCSSRIERSQRTISPWREVNSSTHFIIKSFTPILFPSQIFQAPFGQMSQRSQVCCFL